MSSMTGLAETEELEQVKLFENQLLQREEDAKINQNNPSTDLMETAL